MPDRTQESRQRRSEARSRRRGNAEEPLEEVGEGAGEQAKDAVSAPNGALSSTAAKVVGTMVGAALLGVAGRAAKVLLERRGSASPTTKSDEDTEAETEEHAVPEPSGEADDHPGVAEHEPDVGEDDQDVAEHEPDLAEHDPKLEDEQPEPDTAEPDVEEEGQEQEPSQGVSAGNGAEIIEEARRELASLLGNEPERVSGLERNDDGWTVLLDVVELSRIPESTDVLATYEVRLDDEQNLVGATRTRRFLRSQIEEAS